MYIQNKLSILIWLNRPKATKKTGHIPVYARITIDSDYDEISVGTKVLPQHWDNRSKLAMAKSPDAEAVNSRISQVVVDLKRHFILLDAQYTNVSPQMLKNVFRGLPAIPAEPIANNEKQSLTLLQAVNNHIAFVEEMVDKGKLSKGLLTIFKTTRTKIIEFLSNIYQSEDISIPDMGMEFAYKFYDYLLLKDPAGLDSNTSYKYVKKTKQFITEAKKRGLVKFNPIADFSCKYQQPDRDYLEMYELNNIYKHAFGKRLTEVRDVYLFCCFTGFAYKDVEQLSRENLFIGLDGALWVKKNRQKTDNKEAVPLMPIAVEIITKYKNDPYCIINNCLLPVDSNQKYNAYLKEIANICDIKINLTTHTARHTFATTVTLENDVPLETVSKMLGHKSIKTTQIYARITQRKVSNNMKDLTKKIFDEKGFLK
jgi:site-specific recombinase XerD